MLLHRSDFVVIRRFLGFLIIDRRYLLFQQRLHYHRKNLKVPAIIRGVHPELSWALTSTPDILKTAFAFAKSPNAQTQWSTVRPSYKLACNPSRHGTSSTRVTKEWFLEMWNTRLLL